MRLKRGGKRRFGRRCERGEELPRREGDEGAREEGCRAALGHRGSRCVFVFAERKVKITNETNETTFAVQGGSEEAALPSVLAPLLVRWQRGHRWGQTAGAGDVPGPGCPCGSITTLGGSLGPQDPVWHRQGGDVWVSETGCRASWAGDTRGWGREVGTGSAWGAGDFLPDSRDNAAGELGLRERAAERRGR